MLPAKTDMKYVCPKLEVNVIKTPTVKYGALARKKFVKDMSLCRCMKRKRKGPYARSGLQNVAAHVSGFGELAKMIIHKSGIHRDGVA